MHRSQLMNAFQPALEYWGKAEMPDNVLRIYYDELKGFDAEHVQRAIKQCIREDKYFPRLADLLPKLGAEFKGDRITVHPELLRNYEICERLFDNPDYPHEDTRYPVSRIVKAARRAYSDGLEKGSDKKTERRYVSSAMWEWNIQAFEGMPLA